MQPIARTQKWSNRFDDIDRDLQFKQIMKGLVVRLSETIIRNITAKR
jgi:hypothetical protein